MTTMLHNRNRGEENIQSTKWVQGLSQNLVDTALFKSEIYSRANQKGKNYTQF